MPALRLRTVASSLLALAGSAAAQWHQLPSSTAIGPRIAPAMAAHPSGDVFLFGGATGPGGAGLTNTMHRHDGTDWSLVPTAIAPSPRYEAQMVFDATRGVFVLYGGWTASTSTGVANDETWEWNGTTWTQVSTPQSPGGRWKHGMCFDTSRNRVVLYGGSATHQPGTILDTWEYDGATWQQFGAQYVGRLEDHAMCFDASVLRTVAFGGTGITGNPSNATLRYTPGLGWGLVLPSGPVPPARRGASMVFDPIRLACVMSGGVDANGSPLTDTWEYQSSTNLWRLQPTAIPGSADFGFAFDPARRFVVRFGGAGDAGTTWRYGARVDVLGGGCPGSLGPVAFIATPARLQMGMFVTFSNVPLPGIAFVAVGFAPLPQLPLDGVGMPGCFAMVSPSGLLQATSAPGIGTASWSLPPPYQPALFGTLLYAQGLVLDPGFNAAWLVSTDAVVTTIGH